MLPIYLKRFAYIVIITSLIAATAIATQSQIDDGTIALVSTLFLAMVGLVQSVEYFRDHLLPDNQFKTSITPHALDEETYLQGLMKAFENERNVSLI